MMAAGSLDRPMVPRKLLAPRFLLTHAVIVVVAVAFVALGSWQLDRLSEVQAVDDRLTERLTMAAVPLVALATDGLEPDVAEFRRVEVTGTYVSDEEVLQRSRSHRGANGYHVLTPLEYTDGQAVLVRRGWLPFELDTPPVAEALPPEGEVAVEGFLERSDGQPAFGARDPGGGRLERVFHADLDRIGQQVTPELLPMVLHLEAQSPPQSGELPIAADRPERDEGRHLSYAIQWFSFAAIAVVGYTAYLRSRLRRPGSSAGSRTDDRETSAVT